MFDEDVSPAVDPGDPELLAPTAAPIAWSQEQMLRLENEWRRLQRSFAYHSAVRVQPLHGDPPDEYQIDFQVRTLIVDESGALAYTETCPVHIWLPPGFPFHAPLVRPMIGVFHPNVTMDAIYLSQPWTTTTTLADLVPRIGDVLTFRTYDPAAPWNQAALDYIEQNPQVVPTDVSKELGTNAGGDPLERICRHGTPLIGKVRAQLDQVCDALITGEAPDEAQVVEFSKRTRMTLGLFLEDDVPDSLRAPASELDDFALELGMSPVRFAEIRAQRHAGKAAAQGAHALYESREMLANATRALDKLVKLEEIPEAQQLLKVIPEPGTLQHHEGAVTTLLVQARQLAADLEEGLVPLDSLSLVQVLAGGLLGARLETEAAKSLKIAEDGREKAIAELGRVKPMFARAQERLEGLKRISGWREYADLVARGQDVVRKARHWGSAGLEAYFVKNEDGQFGPFSLEMPLTLGAHMIAVRNPSGGVIEVIDALSGDLRGQSDTGVAIIPLPDPETGKAYNTGVQLTARCDELSVQLAYLVAQTHEALPALEGRVEAGECWLTWFAEALTSPNAQQTLRKAQQGYEQTWKTICAELESLAPFKQRVATYYLLERGLQSAAKLNGRLSELNTALSASIARITSIVSASSTNVDTGQLQVPAKFAKEYPDHLMRRDRCRKEVPRIQRRIDRVVADIKRRTESPELVGLAGLPELNTLSPLPEELLAIVPAMGWENLRATLDDLQQQLGTELPLANESGVGQAVQAVPPLPKPADVPATVLQISEDEE